MKKGELQLDTQYQWYRSHTHFVGTEEQINREASQSQVINNVQELKVGLTRGLDERWSVQGVVPVLDAKRSNRDGLDLQAFANNANTLSASPDAAFPNVKSQFGLTSRAEAGDVFQMGDITLMARRWMFKPDINAKGNIQLGLGIKIPTGSPNETNIQRVLPAAVPANLKVVADGVSTALTGKKVGVKGGLTTAQVIRELVAGGKMALETSERLNDQSIQPGDGGWGAIFSFDAYRKLWPQRTGYLQVLYLFNPQDVEKSADRALNNPAAIGTLTQFLSTPDAYLARAGLIFSNLGGFSTLSGSIGLRWEGVPTHDLIGQSHGFRRPGYYIAIEPGLVRTRGKEVFTLRAPISLTRNRQVSEPESETGDGSQGDAGFADYSVIASYGRRF